MSEHYPKFRLEATDGRLALREGLVLAFFMKRSYDELSGPVSKVLDLYCEAVGREKLAEYPDLEGEWQPLDEAGWEQVRQELLGYPEATGVYVHLVDRADQVPTYEFLYYGKKLDAPLNRDLAGAVSALSVWLPTEELEARGPRWLRELATAMARELPLSSGYASLAFQRLGVASLERELLRLAIRHPGIDILDTASAALSLGTKVRGAYWLNFYGPPLLEQLGGSTGLRAKLKMPGVQVEEVEQGRKMLVFLGEWPEAGDEEAGKEMGAYRELARVLEPHLYEDPVRWPGFWPPQQNRWMRRFLE